MTIRSAVLAVIVSLAWSASAWADPFVFNTPNAPLPSFAGTGLNGEVWTDVHYPDAIQARTLAFARTIAPRVPDVGVTPTGTFRATAVDYPQGAESVLRLGNPGPFSGWAPTATVRDFLGSDCATLTPGVGSQFMHPSISDVNTAEVGTIFRFSGFLRVDAPNTSMRLDVSSDDGSELYIQNVRVLANDGVRSFGDPTHPADVLFTRAGLYALELLYFEAQTDFGGIALSDDLTNQIVPGSLLYQTAAAPEPSGIALLLAGVCGLIAARRRKAWSRSLPVY